MSRQVKIKDLQPGDYVIEWDTVVERRYQDPEGVWLDTSDGNLGYVNGVERKVMVDRPCIN